MAAASLAPLLPKLDAILVLDGDGNRLAGKYYGDFLKKAGEGGKSPEEQRTLFEKQMHAKIAGIAARPDAAEVVQCQGRTAVFCGGTVGGGGGGGAGTTGDVRVVHVGPPNESELVLAHCCEGMYDALSQLMGGSTDRAMVLDNLELVFLLIDEHCDGGIILEVDGSKLAAAVLLRDEDHAGDDGHGHAAASSGGRGLPGMPQGVSTDMTLGQAFRQIGGQLMAAAANRDGM